MATTLIGMLRGAGNGVSKISLGKSFRHSSILNEFLVNTIALLVLPPFNRSTSLALVSGASVHGL